MADHHAAAPELPIRPERIVRFQVFGVAQPKGSTRSLAIRTADGGLRTRTFSDNPNLKDWQHAVASAAQSLAGDGAFSGPVLVRAWFALRRPTSLSKRVTSHLKKPDLDKLLRAVNDALTGVLYTDDSQVVGLNGWKFYAVNAAPSVVIEVEG